MIVWTLTVTPGHAETWMQQPFSSPDEPLREEFDDSGEFTEVDPRPQLTPEQAAERSALEIFPGAAAPEEPDQWRPEGDGSEAPDAQTLEHDPEAHEAPPLPAPDPPTPSQSSLAAEPVEVAAEQPIAEPTPVVPEAPAVEATPSVQQAPAQQPPVEQTPIQQAPEPADPTAPVPARLDDDEFARRALAMPLFGGRERREAAGASQRAAILAQAGTPLDAGEEVDLVAIDQPPAASEPDQQSQPAAAPTTTSGGRTLTRKISLSLFVSALAIVLLSGGAVVSGQGAEIERVASVLTPDPIERWISERVSSFGTSAVAPEPSPPAADPTADPPPLREAALIGRITHTGGAGVSVRTTCVAEARATRTIPDGCTRHRDRAWRR